MTEPGVTELGMQRFEGGLSDWNALIAGLPNAHLLQSWEWAQVKAAYGWQPVPLVWRDSARPTATPWAAAMILKKQILRNGFAARLSILYIPKGPLLDWRNEACRDQVLDDLQRFARHERSIFLKADPDVLLGTGVPGESEARSEEAGELVQSELRRRGWRFASDQIQFRNTVLIDLRKTETALLEQMGQKMRYNVRLAAKKGVTVREGTLGDLPLLYRMYAETSNRDGFVIREEGYYRRVWETFMDNALRGREPSAAALIAEVEGEAVAALFLFSFAQRAYFLYGMSRPVHREKMPNHLLQWEAIRRSRMRGLETYDLWGAPDQFDARDALWGVFRFKQGLGGEVVRTLGAWDYPASRFWYTIYTGFIPKVLDIMRRRGKAKVRQDLAAA